MAFARDVYTATAAQTDFTITFPYLDEDHVIVSVNGVEQARGADQDYVFADATTIRFNSGLSNGDIVVLQRKTSHNTRLTDYTPGALTEADLDNDSLQGFYMAQESIDRAELSLGKDATDHWDATSLRIKNVADGTDDGDAINKRQLDAAVIASGNVPTPSNPAENNYLLKASDGSFSWATASAFFWTMAALANAAAWRSELGAGDASVGTAQTWTAGQRGEVTTLTDGANIAIDLSASNNFTVTLGGNRTLDNPSNATAGQSGVITVRQDGAGSRTLSFGSNYKFAKGVAPVLSTAANAVDVLTYYVISETEVLISHVRDVKGAA